VPLGIANGVIAGIGGYVCLCKWHTPKRARGRLTLRLAYCIWIACIALLEWLVTGSPLLSGIICAELTVFLVMLISLSWIAR
jgi:hypothetical protein